MAKMSDRDVQFEALRVLNRCIVLGADRIHENGITCYVTPLSDDATKFHHTQVCAFVDGNNNDYLWMVDIMPSSVGVAFNNTGGQ